MGFPVLLVILLGLYINEHLLPFLLHLLAAYACALHVPVWFLTNNFLSILPTGIYSCPPHIARKMKVFSPLISLFSPIFKSAVWRTVLLRIITLYRSY